MTRKVGEQRSHGLSAAAAALALGFALTPCSALAVTPPSPDDTSAELAFGESWHRYAQPRRAPTRPTGQELNLQQSHVEAANPSRLRVLRYSAPLRFGDTDLLFKFRAPGKHQSIVTFEIRF